MVEVHLRDMKVKDMLSRKLLDMPVRDRDCGSSFYKQLLRANFENVSLGQIHESWSTQVGMISSKGAIIIMHRDIHQGKNDPSKK